METIAVLPRTIPIVLAWLPEFEVVGGVMEDAPKEDALEEDTLTEDAIVEDVLAEYALVEYALGEDVYTPDGLKIAPGPNSGLSISNVAVRP